MTRIKQLTLRGTLADVSLAMLSSIVTVLGTVAFAAMIFPGPLVKVVPLAFLAFLAGTALSGLLIGLFSRFYCNLSGAQDEPAAILATFALDGPETCSGLSIARHSSATLSDELGSGFRLIETVPHVHRTPWGKTQSFQYSRFERVD